MEFEINVEYNKDEYMAEAFKWWSEHEGYDINEKSETFVIVERSNIAKFYDKKQTIETLKRQLSATDYQAIKYAEGELTADEFAPVKAQRIEWRKRINELEKEVAVDEPRIAEEEARLAEEARQAEIETVETTETTETVEVE